jgi:hypothetical protein
MTARRNMMKTHPLIETVRILAALAAIGFLLPASRASAARIDITPAISLDQVYDSNVFNTDGNEKEDFLFRATPAVTFTWKRQRGSPDVLDSVRMPDTTLNISASLSSETYYKYTELSDAISAISLAINATHRFTPRLSITPSGSFVQAQDSVRRNQLVPSGDPLVPASIASETGTQKSRDYGAALRASYLLTPKTDFSVRGRFSKLQFLDNVAGGGVDSREVAGDTTLSYRFTPLFSSGFFFNVSYNTFEDGTDSRVFAGGLTGSYRFSPSVTMDARAGASRTQESELAGLPDRTTWSPSGLLLLIYAGNTFRATLSGAYEVGGGGSFGSTTRRQTASFSLTDQFASRWWADLTGSYQVRQSLDDTESEDLTSASGSAGIRYHPRENVTLRLSGNAFRQWSDGTVGSDLTRYSAVLGITLGHTYNIY